MISVESFSAQVTTIHEAALAAERWDDVLSGMKTALDACAAGVIAGPAPRQPDVAVSVGFDPAALGRYQAYYGAIDPIVPALQQMPSGTVLTRGMAMAEADLMRTEFYADWLRQQGFRDALFAKFMPGSDAGVICLARPAGAQKFDAEALDFVRALTPHLQIAMQTRQLLEHRRVERDGALETLARLGQAAFFVDATGRVLLANGAAEALLQRADGLTCAASGLQATTATLTAELRRLIARAAVRAGELRRGGSLSLPRPSGKAALAATISPLSRDVSQVMPCHGPEVMVLVAAPKQPSAVPATALCELFGLTPTEAAVAHAIAQGQGAKAAAAALGVATSTLRTHLHRAFGKTGTQRQAELAHLVNQIASSGVSPAT